MFYGTIKTEYDSKTNTYSCSVDTSCAMSNNFSASLSGDSGNSTAMVDITLNEHVTLTPSYIATAKWGKTGKSAAYVEWSSSPTFTIGQHTGNQCSTAIPLSFFAPTGQSLVFDASLNPTLTLEPSIVAFGDGQVLTLTTSISGLDPKSAAPGAGSGSSFAATLDKGSTLLGVGHSGSTMTLSIEKTLKIGGQTWALTGWTYGGDAGVDGHPWDERGDTNTYSLTLGLASPMTTPQSFVIMATTMVSGKPLTLTSDPLVRLSNVPPAGLSM